ncbi:MFS transporter [soil metagenome]
MVNTVECCQRSDVQVGKATSASLFLPIMVCSLAACFYLYEFILQVAPAVMTHELMRDLALDASGLGAMSAFYYYSYAPMQLPAGMLFDRFGPRRLITLAIMICVVGAFFFSMTHGVMLASAGRMFMGIGSAFSFIGALLLIARWFPPQYFALLAGIAQAMSSLGALVGEVPLAEAVARLGWRQSMFWLGIIGTLLAIFIWLFVKDHPPGYKAAKIMPEVVESHEMQNLRQLLKNSQTWLIAIYSFCSWSAVVVFAALWGVPYLQALYGVSTAVASSAISMIWIGIGIGSPLLGWFSDKIGRRCLPLSLAAAIGLIVTLALVTIPHIPLYLMYVLCFGIGLAASAQSLTFGVVKDLTPPKIIGTAIGFNNMAVVAGGAIFQPLVGWLLHLQWNGQFQAGTPVYHALSYQHALIILPICYLVGLIISQKLLRETYCRSSY